MDRENTVFTIQTRYFDKYIIVYLVTDTIQEHVRYTHTRNRQLSTGLGSRQGNIKITFQ